MSSIPRDFFTPGQPPVEITDPDVTQEKISEFWPNVVYKNKDVMDLMYNDTVFKAVENELNDYQEVYLGWDPDSDQFIMGFDTWDHGGIYWSYAIINNFGLVKDVDSGWDGGIYPKGRKAIRERFPNILELRLD
ncbi:MAG TPA: hypothetical protein DHN29_21960 [Cytophagales bacterium]|jgi:hypothetical protein|nr:hypothetical protein [Cytophagales bacterium]|tara:strand:+ start:2001 stop:2402 length:402 start_codon:yes stop_codon:yes gene_type:complete